MIGKSVFDYVIEDDRRRLAENISRLLQTGTRHNTEYTVLRQDGITVPTEISSAITRDATGQPIAIMVVIRDITERKRAEEALKQNHDELQAIYDGMVDGCVIFDTEDFTVVRANAALCTMLGYSEEEIEALTPEQKHPSYFLPRIKEYYAATLQGQRSFIENVPIFHKEGHALFFDIATTNISYSGRRCQLLFFHDVTERKQAEEALQKEHRTLKHLLQSSDHERQTIAYEIHDGLAQYLAGAIMQFDVYKHQLEKSQTMQQGLMMQQ